MNRRVCESNFSIIPSCNSFLQTPSYLPVSLTSIPTKWTSYAHNNNLLYTLFRFRTVTAKFQQSINFQSPKPTTSKRRNPSKGEIFAVNHEGSFMGLEPDSTSLSFLFGHLLKEQLQVLTSIRCFIDAAIILFCRF